MSALITKGRIAAHRARIEGAHQAVPEQVGHRRAAVDEATVGIAEDPEHQRDGEDPERCDDAQTGDQRDGPAGHEVVEAVAEAFSNRRLLHRCLGSGGTLDRRTRG
jgi:hypothetical protein